MTAAPRPASSSLTEEEVLALPVVFTLEVANRVFALGRTTGYDLIRRGLYPCEVHRIGRHYRVYKADLVEALRLRCLDVLQEDSRIAA